MHLHCKPDEIPELLKAHVGAEQVAAAISGVVGLDQGFENVLAERLNPVAEQKFLVAGETIKRGHQPQEEAEMALENGTDLTRCLAHLQKLCDSRGAPPPTNRCPQH